MRSLMVEKVTIEENYLEEYTTEMPSMDAKFIEKSANVARFASDLPMCFEKAVMNAYFYVSLKKYKGVDLFWKKSNLDEEI